MQILGTLAFGVTTVVNVAVLALLVVSLSRRIRMQH
jgi:hypothetical protein